MAGASFGVSIKTDDRDLRAALARVAATIGRLEPALRDIGEALLIRERARFARQESPEGVPWEPLKPLSLARKKKNKDKVLIESGLLKDLMRYTVTGNTLAFGTDRIYGATHQFGAPKRGIPARPFLGLSAEDEREIMAILADHVRSSLG